MNTQINIALPKEWKEELKGNVEISLKEILLEVADRYE